MANADEEDEGYLFYRAEYRICGVVFAALTRINHGIDIGAYSPEQLIEHYRGTDTQELLEKFDILLEKFADRCMDDILFRVAYHKEQHRLNDHAYDRRYRRTAKLQRREAQLAVYENVVEHGVCRNGRYRAGKRRVNVLGRAHDGARDKRDGDKNSVGRNGLQILHSGGYDLLLGGENAHHLLRDCEHQYSV